MIREIWEMTVFAMKTIMIIMVNLENVYVILKLNIVYINNL